MPTTKLLSQLDQILPACPTSTPDLFPLASPLLFPCLHVPFPLLGVSGFKIKRKAKSPRVHHKKVTLQVLLSPTLHPFNLP